MTAKLLKLTLSAFFAFMAMGCEKAAELCCFAERIAGESLEGSWLLYETGYSPGAGYHVDAVPPEPAQVITFAADGQLLTNLETIQEFKYYRILDDPYNVGEKILALFTEDPGDETPDVSTLEHSYLISRDNNNLRLAFRYCIEGCHMALRPVTLDQ